MGILNNLFSIFQDQRETLDLTSFGDELALRISWEPLVGGGTNFCTHRLRAKPVVSNDLIEFEITLAAILFSVAFLAAGLVGLIGAASSGSNLSILAAIAMMGFGIWNAYQLAGQKTIFDRSLCIFVRKGRTASLENIRAIQLVREYIRGNRNSYYSYELNLVCSSGDRINIVDHGSLRAIREDAEMLANFLSIPVWDAIDYRVPEQAADWNSKFEILRNNIG
ncbi:hypothetical protein SynA15127_01049 [Synechococcus sp. A15-127]|uniref:hypothetical protein n=1 Tax=Synechococcus sp. A15-127 TaxID=1050624 RepID=UPI001644E45D|nr:hypothetical protein [Synechococcus sp. A15-127]QNI94131.1 hypothetical protein SynA15127_01049 [Synechococcus sp. A15-127]